MKKTIFLLAILLIVSQIVACSDVDESFEVEYDLSYSEDWGGETFSILQSATTAEPFYYLENTILADSALNRISEVGKRFNCIVELTNTGSISSYLSGSLAAGVSPADIVFTTPSNLNGAANAGGFVNLETVSDIINIHETEKWGEPNVWEFGIFKGVLNGVVPISWLSHEPFVYYPIVFNADITRSFGYSDLREFYENGTWTREKLFEVVVNCTDDTRATPIKGMAAALKHFIRSALLSNGTQFAIFNDDVTEYSCGWNSPAGIEALSWVQHVLTEYDEFMFEFSNPAYGDWNYTNPFINGETALLLTCSREIFKYVAYQLENFGILPFPVGPYGEEGKWVGFYETAYVATIPLFAKEVEASATLINTIFEPLDQYPTSADIIDYYNTNVFSDDRDYAILQAMSENCKYSFWPSGGDAVLNSLVSHIQDSTPIEIFETYGHGSDSCIINQMIPSILTVRRLTGDESYN